MNAEASAVPAAPLIDAPPLLFALEQRPPWPQAVLAALAHLLAIVASIATAPLLIAQVIGLDPPTTGYVIGSALTVSGIATLLQILRLGPFGSGLLSIQGTSFAFIGPFALGGAMLAGRGLAPDALLGVLLGCAAAGALVTVVAGYFVEHLARVITRNVTGIAIVLLGLTLVQAAWGNFGYALAAAVANGLPAGLIWAEAIVVIGAIAVLATRRSPWLRLSSICTGLVIGMAFAALLGDTPSTPAAPLNGLILPRLLPFPLGFDLAVWLLLLPIFFVTVTESIGDLTATAMLSRQPIGDRPYWQRIRGGVMADGLNSVLAACAGTFPNTTFSQNNGVIRLTGVASRMVGVLVAGLLIVLGALPGFVALFQAIPGGVLHPATGLLFAMIALSGWRLLRGQADQPRTLKMLAGCALLAFALSFVPGLLGTFDVTLPDWLALLFGFPVATGTVAAIVWERLAP